jgi:hypothetical protein
MAKETKSEVSNELASQLLSALANQVKQATAKTEPTSGQLCEELLEQNMKPHAFRRRLIAQRRALGKDDNCGGNASGSATTVLKPTRTTGKRR